ncbi:MAG: NAD-dependent epimerase/dehydratase family protein [Acidobacteria bacterium]|nr:NAD-dependent epimerase/dehydratase family protein [Acidobacteriota bacterium]
MTILVTGGAGYLGSVLVPKLVARGHRVRVLDVGYFGLGHLGQLKPAVEVIRGDLRLIRTSPQRLHEIVADCDCIIHLAAISNDPSAELNPELTDEVNFRATSALAETAKAAGIKFIFSSSCSVYGEESEKLVEGDAVAPLTAYAVSKVMAEQALKELADAHWSPIILRNGTLFGYSPRMRFDLVVNIFSLYSAQHNEIKIFGNGEHWRPFLHVGDCARAFVYFAELAEPQHLCYNVAHENLRVIDVAELFRRINPRLSVVHLDMPDADHRNYQVSTRRLRAEGFKTQVSVRYGAEEMVEAIVSGLIPNPESIYYRNAKWLKELTQIGSRNHSEIVTLMEMVADTRGVPR